MGRPKKTQETNTEEKVATPTMTIEFRWLEAKPDNRQYRQNSIVLNPANVYIGVQIPLTHEFILNSAEIIKYQLDQGGTPLPVLTPKGLRYCLDQLDKEFSETTKDTVEDEDLAWENDTEENTQEESTSTENNTEWSDDDDFDDDTKDLQETDFEWE